ncbi:MAG: hypothetical protein IJ753_05295 [Bacteroidales bacterium]|nr:hypothetical protein [Bacteroidales bacterium]MBR1782914.1 hypothetical protein [Bacteroidales bacterium]
MKNLLPILFAALLLSACAEPLSTETFIPGDGPYVFTVDLSDSAAVFDLDLYTRLDGTPEELLPLDGTNLRVEWKAPTDSVYVEKMYLPLDRGKKSYFSAQVYESFKADWTPSMPGLWTLTLRPEDRSELLPLRGMGLVVTRKY